MTRIDTDICVIGAGSGGLSVAAGAVQMGARVVLIEGHRMGGDCLNYGCVPSKALIAAAAVADTARRGFAGVAAHPPTIDFAATRDHVDRVIAAIAPIDSEERFTGLGCRVIRDWARFTSPTTVAAGGFTVAARRFVIATGSRPAVPPISGLDTVPYLTNESIFALRDRPDHLLILGGGPIGLEMAQAHSRLGCRVTVVEASRALAREEPALAAELLGLLRAEGIDIREGQPVTRVSSGPDGITLHLGEATLSGSHLLVATGRRVALDRLAPKDGGIAVTDRGVKVDARLRSVTNRRVFAVGDAAGGGFTHVAGYHAALVVRQAVLGLPARLRDDHIPRVTYTDPELAHVGLSEAEARRRFGAAVEVVTAAFHDNDRAVAMARTEGQARLLVVRGRPVGVTILGPHAGETIAPWALAIAARLRLSAMAGTILPYPTLAEINKRVTGAYFAPRLFHSAWVRRVVGVVQRWFP